MSFKDQKFLKHITLRRASQKAIYLINLEVDDLKIEFIPIEEEFTYVDLSREKSVLGWFMNVEFSSRWVAATHTLLPYLQKGLDLALKIDAWDTPYYSVYIDTAPKVEYGRQLADKSFSMTLKAKEPFLTLPTWAENVKPNANLPLSE